MISYTESIETVFRRFTFQMSFIDIPDPNRREEIVAHYRRLKRKAHDDDVNSRLGELEAQKAIVAKSKPIVESIGKVADKIQESTKRVRVEDDAPPFYEEYTALTNNRDHVFGMYKKDEDTFWFHSGHPREKLRNQTDLLFFVFLFHV